MTTVFYSRDGRQHIIPNSYLCGEDIVQLKRSKHFAFSFDFKINATTPTSKIKLLKENIFALLKKDTYLDWDLEECMFYLTEVQPNHYYMVEFWGDISKMNWMNTALVNRAKTSMCIVVQESCKKLNISYDLPVQNIVHLDNNKKFI